MSRKLVLALALVPGTAASTPLLPLEGHAVYRPECFSHPEEDEARSRSMGSYGVGGGRVASAPSSPAKQSAGPPPPAPMPAAEAAAPDMSSAMDGYDLKEEVKDDLRQADKPADEALRRDGRQY